jgi:hypothetical protein
MRKKISIDRFTPRAPLPEELRPDWLSSAVAGARMENSGGTTERGSHIGR